MNKFADPQLTCPPDPTPAVASVYSDDIYLLEQRISVYLALALKIEEGIGNDALAFIM